MAMFYFPYILRMLEALFLFLLRSIVPVLFFHKGMLKYRYYKNTCMYAQKYYIICYTTIKHKKFNINSRLKLFNFIFNDIRLLNFQYILLHFLLLNLLSNLCLYSEWIICVKKKIHYERKCQINRRDFKNKYHKI